jgi:hypothetical protein
MMGAVQSLFCGLILDTIKQKNRQDFEFQLQQVQDTYQQKERELV